MEYKVATELSVERITELQRVVEPFVQDMISSRPVMGADVLVLDLYDLPLTRRTNLGLD